MSRNPVEFMKAFDGELFENIASGQALAFNDGVLARKQKLLIALAIDASHSAEAGVRSLAQQAIAAGATKEEIKEALRVAYYISGVASMYTAARALDDIL